MATTYTPGYGGTMTVNSAALPVQNVTVDISRSEIDVTKSDDLHTVSMAGRVSRKVSCTALVTSATEALITAVMTEAAGTAPAVSLSWNDGNGASISISKVMCVSASKSYDNSGAATVSFQFAESL